MNLEEIVKSTLIVGQTYKNYKMLCQTLKQIPKKGNSKKSQVKEFKRYFDWEQQGQELTITVIYDTPKEKIDNRVNNGQNVNSLKALDENRGHRERTIPLDLLKVGYSHIGQGTHGQIDIFQQLGLWNEYTHYFIFQKDDILYNKDSPFKECDYDVIDIVINNLYNSSRNKSLCEYVKQGKIIVYCDEDNNIMTRFAEDWELDIIKEIEDEVINTFNSTNETTFKKYSDIYIYATKEQRMSIKNMKGTKLQKRLLNYDKDKSCFIIDSIEVDFEFDKDEVKKQINLLFYENEVQRITNYYDKKIDMIRQDSNRHLGNIKTHKIKRLEENKEYSLKLLEYVLKLDLTKEEHFIIKKMFGLTKKK